jgi:phage internal scaffolding protein
MSKIEVKNRFSPSLRMPTINDSGQRAQQQFKDDADINTIMRKFQKTGVIDHVSRYQPEYGFASPMTLHESMNIVKNAETMFADLPSSVRNRFENSPLAFLEFVQDGKNYEEAKSLGLELAPGVEPIVAEGTATGGETSNAEEGPSASEAQSA